MSTVVCPACGATYLDWVTRCAQCGVAVERGEVDVLALPEDEQVVYELAEWSLAQRTNVAAALAERGIPHAWEVTDLIVHVDDEAVVDEIVEAIERGEDVLGDEELDDLGLDEVGLDDTGGGEPGAIDTDGVTVTVEVGDGGATGELLYELGGWTSEERERLGEELVGRGVTFRFDERGDLIVPAEAEEDVEAALDAMEAGDDDEADLAAADLLSSLFLAADRLQHEGGDLEALATLRAALGEALTAAPPYGFSVGQWRGLLAGAEQVVALADADDVEGVEAQAATLRAALRDYV